MANRFPKRGRKIKRGTKYIVDREGKKIVRPAGATINEIKLLVAGVKKSDEGIEGEVIQSECDEYGRQYAMTQEKRLLVIEAFAWGCTVEESALFAKVSASTLYTFFKENPKFEAHCRELQDTPILLARKCLVEAAGKNPFFALKYLERRKADEFALTIRQSLTTPEPPDEDELKLLDEVLNDNLDS